MSDDRHSINGDLPLAALVRLAADGEISAEQERRLESELEQNPELARQIEAEQLLRSSLERAFSDGQAAPAGLRDRVAAAMASVELNSEQSDDADVPTRMATMTRDRSFWAGPAARVLAAAAALTLVATVFVVSRGGVSSEPISNRTRAVQFVASEHGRCVIDLPPGTGKFRVSNADEMPGLTGDVLGREITLADLVVNGAENVSFIDAGRCGVPGGGKSMHMRFEVPSDLGGDPERFSLFVQQDEGGMALTEGVTYELDPSGGGEIDLKSPSIYVWLRGDLVYYLVVDNAKNCRPIRERLAAPEDLEPLTDAA
ncbi:MAG: hypothetical protein AAFR76_01290 [Planctomycetota bacterium]